MTNESQKTPSIPTVRRLPSYLSVLRDAQKQGMATVSSSYIAKKLKLESIQVRKDISSTGLIGQPRIGFSVPELIDVIESFLGYKNAKDAFIAGAGHLGSALMGYSGFKGYGLNIVLAFDVDSQKVGTKVDGIEIFHLDKLEDLVSRLRINIAILTVPDAVAQNVTDVMVKAGVRAIWNFTSVKLSVPDDIIVERVDLVASLATLSSKLKQSILSNE